MCLRLDLETVLCIDLFFFCTEFCLKDEIHAARGNFFFLGRYAYLWGSQSDHCSFCKWQSDTRQHMFPYFCPWGMLAALHLYMLGASQIWTSHLAALEYSFVTAPMMHQSPFIESVLDSSAPQTSAAFHLAWEGTVFCQLGLLTPTRVSTVPPWSAQPSSGADSPCQLELCYGSLF